MQHMKHILCRTHLAPLITPKHNSPDLWLIQDTSATTLNVAIFKLSFLRLPLLLLRYKWDQLPKDFSSVLHADFHFAAF